MTERRNPDGSSITVAEGLVHEIYAGNPQQYLSLLEEQGMSYAEAQRAIAHAAHTVTAGLVIADVVGEI